jgi:hypothetical protein
MTKLLLAIVLIGAAAAAAIAANLALLRYAGGSNDPVGRLTPHASLPSLPAAPARVLTPVDRPPDNEGTDD